MNFYITSGTLDYMKRFYYKNQDKIPLFLLFEVQKKHVTLFYESNQKSIFGNPRKYVVLNGIGSFSQYGIYMLKHITVEKEDQEYFEKRFGSYIDTIKNSSGLIAYRFLRPVKGSDYMVVTAWVGDKYAEKWEVPKEYFIPSSQVLHGDFFQIPMYTKKYMAPTEEDIEERLF